MSERPNDDLDPALLRESGRASAIQDLADQAKKMGDRAVALERSTQNALTQQIKRWRRSTYLMSAGIVLLLFIGFINASTNEDNKKILTNVEALLEDVDTLVAFVEDVQADSQEPDPRLTAALEAAVETRRVICESADPGIIEACQELGG